MPRKNNNARKPRRLSAVTEPTTPTRTVAKNKLWAALRANSGATTAELAMQAGIGKSTAGKLLAGWNTDGKVDRTSGAQDGGRRGADRWTIPAEASADADSPPTDTDGDASAAGASGDDTGATTNEDASSSRDVDGTQPAAAAATDSADTAKRPRLGKGALRGLVEEYLRAHPGEQFSPNAIGTALNRSSGAVNNALEKLVADGYAVRTQDKPKRFAIKPET